MFSTEGKRSVDVQAARAEQKQEAPVETSYLPVFDPKYKRRVLSAEEVETFQKDGFLFLSDFLTPLEKQQLVMWTEQVQSWPETAHKWMQYFETRDNKRQLCRTENYIDYADKGLQQLILHKINDAISDLMYESAIIFKEKINYKFPGGAGFTPHQDSPAYVRFNARYHITAMVAVDPMTIENGCLEVVKGEHGIGMVPHPGGQLEDELTAKYERAGKWEPVEAPSGGVMLFHSYLPHRSGRNNSKAPRRAHYLTYNPLSDGDFRTAYYADKRRYFPPDIERIPGVDYSEGAKIYNLSNPITKKL